MEEKRDIKYGNRERGIYREKWGRDRGKREQFKIWT
jgi:hypothetical protein